jgi:uncharacterized membrane protein
MPPLVWRAVLYELFAMLLVFLVGWAWAGRVSSSVALTAVLFVVLTAYYYIFHRLWPSPAVQ